MGRASMPKGAPRPSAPDVWLTSVPYGAERPGPITLPGQPDGAPSEVPPAPKSTSKRSPRKKKKDLVVEDLQESEGEAPPGKEKRLVWKQEGYWQYEEVTEHNTDSYG